MARPRIAERTLLEGQEMTLNKDIAIIIMFLGLIVLIIGGIEMAFPVQGIHLIYGGLLICFGGSYFRWAEDQKEKREAGK